VRTDTDDDLWSAIADPSRRRVLDHLVRRGEASASAMARGVPFSRQAVSKHLVVLEHAGLISRRKQGREVLYHVEADRLDEATRAMAELARQWDRRLDRLRRLAEATHAKSKASKDRNDRSESEAGTDVPHKRKQARATPGSSTLERIHS
jgi:DNA-binding transcriptional ArsR family regulator